MWHDAWDGVNFILLKKKIVCNKEIADPGQPLLLNHPKKNAVTDLFDSGVMLDRRSDRRNTHTRVTSAMEIGLMFGLVWGLMYKD